jgi:hypothetical protein
MSSTTLYRLSGIILLFGALVSVIAGLMTLLLDVSNDSPKTIQNPLWPTYFSLFFVAVALLLMGLPALYLRQAGGRGGVLGFIGVLLMVLGSFLQVAIAGYFVFILPVLAAQAPQLIDAGFEAGFEIIPLSWGVLLTIGPILLGIAVIRAKVFPPFVGILLLVVGILSPSTVVFSGLLATLVGLVSTVSAAIAYSWVGTTLVRQQHVAGAEVPSSAPAALR